MVKLKNMLETRQKQVEEMSRMLTDMDGKINAEKKNLKDNLTFVDELDRRVRDKELELHEIQKEKEILFGKLQVAHKEAGKHRNVARNESSSLMSKVTSFFSFGSKTEDPKAKNFIETSKGFVSKSDEIKAPQGDQPSAPKPTANPTDHSKQQADSAQVGTTGQTNKPPVATTPPVVASTTQPTASPTATSTTPAPQTESKTAAEEKPLDGSDPEDLDEEDVLRNVREKLNYIDNEED